MSIDSRSSSGDVSPPDKKVPVVGVHGRRAALAPLSARSSSDVLMLRFVAAADTLEFERSVVG